MIYKLKQKMRLICAVAYVDTDPTVSHMLQTCKDSEVIAFRLTISWAVISARVWLSTSYQHLFDLTNSP